MSTPSQEDYLEAIWILIHEKGYARVTDLAERLGLSTASVSRMVRRLHDDGLLTYERYRGFSFTERGGKKGRLLYERHQILAHFIRIIGIADKAQAYRIVEGIEHHFDADALHRLEALITYVSEHPAWWQDFLDALGPEGDRESLSQQPPDQ